MASTSLIFPGHDVAGAGGCSDSSGRPRRRPAISRAASPARRRPAARRPTPSPPSRPAPTSTTAAPMPALQVEMGLVGAIIVRPYGFDEPQPDRLRPPRHRLRPRVPLPPARRWTRGSTRPSSSAIASPAPSSSATTSPTTGSSTAAPRPTRWPTPGVPWLPTQPYNTLPRMTPGETVLMRVVGGGRDRTPSTTTATTPSIVARDGRMLESAPGQGPDLGYEVFTIQSVPGETVTPSSPGPARRWAGTSTAPPPTGCRRTPASTV